MKRNLLIILLVLLIALMAVVPAFAAGPCEGGSEPGNSDYAQNHIVLLAKQGLLGAEPSGHAHTPGAHQGFSTCLE